MSDQNKKYKIGLVGDSLSKGGAEKVHALLSIYFANQGFDVQNCIFIDAISYQYSGTVLNLGKIKPKSSSIVRKYHRFFALQNFVFSNKFDCLIDFRMRPSFILEFILSRLVYPKNTIYTVRSSILEFYFPKSIFLSKLIYKNREIIAVSKAISYDIKKRYLLKNTHSIYNPIDFDGIFGLKENIISEYKYILAAGSMDSSIKQIDKLILSYSKTLLPKQNIKLIILGDGKLREEYENLVNILKLNNFIYFRGFLSNPFLYYKNALFFVLSSKNEGFPNVIIESLACETPVISFDCSSGPSEIIINHHNGILVENQNFDQLILAMNTMIENKELYLHCKQNAKSSVEKFSIEKIGKQWLELMKMR